MSYQVVGSRWFFSSEFKRCNVRTKETFLLRWDKYFRNPCLTVVVNLNDCRFQFQCLYLTRYWVTHHNKPNNRLKVKQLKRNIKIKSTGRERIIVEQILRESNVITLDVILYHTLTVKVIIRNNLRQRSILRESKKSKYFTWGKNKQNKRRQCQFINSIVAPFSINFWLTHETYVVQENCSFWTQK